MLRSLGDRKRYVGMSDNRLERLRDNNLGKCPATRFRRPLVMTYFEVCGNRREAHEREKYFKTAAGRRYLDEVETPIWESLRSARETNESDPPDRT